MTGHAENVLLALLDDVDAVEMLAKDAMSMECIPTESLRPVVQWVIDYYFKSHRLQAPSKEAITETWGRVLDDAEATLGDGTETDTMDWAIEHLKANFITLKTQQFSRQLGNDITEAQNVEKASVLASAVHEISQLHLNLSSHINSADIDLGFSESEARVRDRKAAGMSTHGLLLDLPMVDEHLSGIHDGEICVVAAGPKTGKSLVAGWVAFHQAQRDITVLYTLENSVEMTYDRMVCMALGIDSRAYQRGECEDFEIDRIQIFRENRLKTFDGWLYVVKPDPKDATMTGMLRAAELLGARNVIIDQLTFVTHPEPGRKGRPEIIRDLMHELKDEATRGRHKMRVMVMHQINREGVKAAQKSGSLSMEHLAEGSEVERTADLVLSLLQSVEQRKQQKLLMQVLASRRTDIQNWDLSWDPSKGHMSVDNVAVIEGE